ncbi:MAG: ATP-dependent DNA helicase RecG [Clostridia bacterium]|nr:ATP-dependent DNA helicase RecG [Clostridia bacterium]
MAGVLDQPVQYLKAVGPRRAGLLGKLGVHTLRDLLLYFPRHYEDRRILRPLGQLVPGETVTAGGTVVGLEERQLSARLRVLRACLEDTSGRAWATWFNQDYLKQRLRPGQTVVVSGRVKAFLGIPEILVTDFETAGEAENLHTGRIVPFYPLTAGLSQRILRQIVFRALEYASSFPEVLPEEIRARYRLPGIAQSLRDIHFPPDKTALRRARLRLAYEELFVFQLALLARRRRWQSRQKGIAHAPDGELSRRFLAELPFSLTPAQERVLREIKTDMESPWPMARLLQGDVGAGKTVVAAAAMVKAVEGGYQAVLMAPTELLAEQHWAGFRRWLAPLGLEVGLLTGSLAKKEKEEVLARTAAGSLPVVVGTHALIQEEVRFRHLGLVVIDEQHRFGVTQRASLLQKGWQPDVLVMTATPIPRTLALTLYGDLEVSVIDGLPPGRQPVITVWLPESRRQEAYAAVRREVAGGGQAYVVCPLVEESEALQAEAAQELAARLSREVFPDLTVGLVHGRLKREERERVMEAFRRGAVQVLVATTVIEVGVDVPQATVMVIEGAERFGLAQLHQLRGRVGRAARQAYCYLLGRPRSAQARERLRILSNCHDGFAVAEADLRLRGPGDFFGTRQHGLPQFRLADPVRDSRLVLAARRDAQSYLARTYGRVPALENLIAERNNLTKI